MLYEQNGHIKSFDEVQLYYRIVERGHSRWLILTPGVGEHSGRYKDLVAYFAKWFNVLVYDTRGHGKSSGRRAYVKSFFDFSKDLMFVLHFLRDQYNAQEYSLYGHSMGGLIVSDFIQNFSTLFDDTFPYPKKVLLSSPAVCPGSRFGKVIRALPLRLTDKLTAANLPLYLSGFVQISDLSHDPRVFEMYMNDPLVLKKIHLNLLLQIVLRGKKVFSAPLNCRCPLFCVVGSEDRLVDPILILKYFQDEAQGAASEILLVEGGFHELHNEVDRYYQAFEQFLFKVLVS